MANFTRQVRKVKKELRLRLRTAGRVDIAMRPVFTWDSDFP